MDQQASQLLHVIYGVLRRTVAIAVHNCAVVGAAYCGDADLLAAMQRQQPGPPTPARTVEMEAREIAEGIAEIEAFLARERPRP